MNDYYQYRTLDRTDCVPPLFAFDHAINIGDAERIVKDELRCFKVDSVLDPIRLNFGEIPFEPLASTESAVEQTRSFYPVFNNEKSETERSVPLYIRSLAVAAR